MSQIGSCWVALPYLFGHSVASLELFLGSQEKQD